MGAERQAWIRNPPPGKVEQEREYLAGFTARIEAWCDQGAGSCALRQSDIRAIVSRALMHFEAERHWQHAGVVMPNHVHVLFSVIGTHPLTEIAKSWKTFTARQIHARIGGISALWMKDYFDRLVRDATHLWRCARYIRRNPAKAVGADEFTLFEAPFVQPQLDLEEEVRRSGFPAADLTAADRQTGRLGSRPSVQP